MSGLEKSQKAGKVRVLIADDSLYMRRMLRQMLEGHPDIDLIDEAKDGVEAVAKCISPVSYTHLDVYKRQLK